MTTFEHKELKGITIKNMVFTIISTATIVMSVMGTYFELKGTISLNQQKQEAQNRINDMRLKILEGQVAVLQNDIENLKTERFTRPSN